MHQSFRNGEGDEKNADDADHDEEHDEAVEYAAGKLPVFRRLDDLEYLGFDFAIHEMPFAEIESKEERYNVLTLCSRE